jgi:hypothetical protein
MGKIIQLKKAKQKKIASDDLFKENPLIKHGLNELSMEFIEKVHKFTQKNTDVQAIVRVSFEFFE